MISNNTVRTTIKDNDNDICYKNIDILINDPSILDNFKTFLIYQQQQYTIEQQQELMYRNNDRFDLKNFEDHNRDEINNNIKQIDRLILLIDMKSIHDIKYFNNNEIIFLNHIYTKFKIKYDLTITK